MKSLPFLGIVALSCLVGLPASAQDSSAASSQESDSILTFTAVPLGAADSIPCTVKFIDRAAVAIDIEYHGQKPLHGFMAAIYYREPGEQTAEHYRLFTYLGETIVPGQKWQSIYCGLPADADLKNLRFKVDLLGFVDQSISGPRDLRQSNHFYGVLEGMNFVAGSPEAKYVAPVPVASISGDPVPSGDDSLPLEFNGTVERGDSERLSLTIEATNKGSVPVVGYEFKISFFDHATGAFVRSFTTKTLATTGDSSDYLLPGASWSSGPRRLSASSDGIPDDYKITLDTVVLADGRVLGPRRSRESAELLGMLEAIQAAKLKPGSAR
jgi:hypothetical protein